MTTADVRLPRAGYRLAWGESTFRILFLSRALGSLADTFRNVALSLIIYVNTDSPLLGALTYGIAFLPQLAGGTLLAAVADRVRPRLLITTGYAAEALAAVVLAGLRLPVWASLALVALVSALTPTFLGSSSAVMARALTGDAYVLGRSLSSMASSLTQILGLAGGGAMAALLGARDVLWITAGCHLLAAAMVRMRLRDCPAPERAGQESVVRQSWTGNVRMLRHQALRILLLAQWLPCMLLMAAEGLVIPYAADGGLGQSTGGPLLACLPCGMAVGSFVTGRLLSPQMRERLVAPLMALLGLPLLPFIWSPGPAFAAVLLFIAGTGFSYGLGVQARFREASPEEERGQAFTLMSTGLMTLQGIGPLLGGTLAEALPIGPVIALVGAATVLMAMVFQRQLPAALRR
ncbi:MFS transporter [Streptomyces eurythermus]|uniref:MFS transporter n=1 Tax=Streptomyces eurythermus TaxID=42237 RepID=UPI0033D58C37